VVAGGLITEVFAVNASRQLTCNGTVVADNIENLQIEYGVDANSDGSLESYQTAAGVADFSKVTAVRINLLARGSSTNVAANSSQTYTYDGAVVTATDGFLRQVYTATYTVRNQSR
jgi:type IV pilus assembly protein PilW